MRISWRVAIFGLCLGLGTYVRYSNFFHPGFGFDTNILYIWTSNAVDMGFIEFWRSYDGFFDYLPGAVMALMPLAWLSRLFDGGEELFVTLLKLWNWLFEIVFLVLLYVIHKKYQVMSTTTALLCLGIVYILPSFWFISALWGQIDTPIVVLGMISFVLLFEKPWTKKQLLQPFLLSGIFWAVGFWIKMQAILLVPVYGVLFATMFSWKQFRQFTIGVLGASVLINLVPVLVNPWKFGFVVATPFIREPLISKSAATFWTLIGMQGYSFQPILTVGDTAISVKLASSLLYVVSMAGLTYVVLPIAAKDFVRLAIQSPRQAWSVYGRTLVSFENAVMLMTTYATVYFLFVMKMYERYLHHATMYAVVGFFILKNWRLRALWGIGALILNLGHILNLVDTYSYWGYAEPVWVSSFDAAMKFNPSHLSSVLTLSALWIFVIVLVRYATDRNNL